MKKYSALPILFFLFVINAFSQANFTLKDLAGVYIFSSGFVGASFSLKDDGKYEYRTFSDCCDPVWKQVGTYTIKENVVHFKIIQYTLNEYNLFDPKERKEALVKLYHKKEEDIKDEKIETKNEMHIVRWGERLYLLNYKDLYKFAAAVNLGIEPRNEIIHRDFLSTQFYLKIGDEKKNGSGKPNLPLEWLPYILNSPLTAKITKVEGEKREKKYTINKGSKDGLKVGMCFVGKNVKIEYSNLMWVVSVEEHSAKVEDRSLLYPPEYKVGDILTTKSFKGK
jgi:hypothetical protein